MGWRLQTSSISITASVFNDLLNHHYVHTGTHLQTIENTRQWHCTVNQRRKSEQRFHCNLPWASTVSTKTFLHNQMMPCGFQPRRCVSTEPTTAYEIILASKPVQLSQDLLEQFHDVTGLPWWASIILSTFVFRGVLTFPLGVYTQYIKAKVERLQPEIVLMTKQAFVRRFAERVKLEGWTEKRVETVLARLAKHYSKELFIRDNCHPAKGSILLLIQLPLWVCLSLSLRNMTGAFGGAVYLDTAKIVPSLSTEGVLWIPDLTMVDPYYILPVLVGVLNLCNIEMMALHGNTLSRTQRYVTNFLRGISLCMIPISAYIPTAMTLYWATSAFYGLGQNILLKSPKARSILHIPSASSDSETPFRDMGDIFKRRYLRRKDEDGTAKNVEEEDVVDEKKTRQVKRK